MGQLGTCKAMDHRGRPDPPRGIPLPGHHLHPWDRSQTRLTGPRTHSRQESGSSPDGHRRHTDGLLLNSLLAEDW